MSDSSTLQPELPRGEGPNQDSIINTDANAPSDDLFGEDPPETTEAAPTAAEVKAAPEPSIDAIKEQSPAPLTSEPVDSQPTSGAAPVTENSSGITPVAQFVPSDANLDQPIVSSAEPLITEDVSLDMAFDVAADKPVDKDTEMNDAPSQDITSQEQPTQDTASKDDASALVDSAHSEKPEAPPVDVANSVPTPPAEKPEFVNGKLDESEVAVGGDEETQTSQDAPTSSAQGIATPQVVEQPDQHMMDTPSSGTVRPRDDNETGDEPVAKRARTEEQAGNAPVEFKQPDAPSVATTNGDGVHAPAPASTTSGPRFSTEPMKAATKAVLLEKMKNTKKVKSATFFLKPVDYVAMNIPHYPSVIEHPMDLGTMEKKLKADQYPSLNDFVADFELIINNCITFNGAQHLVSISGQNLRAYFMKQMETVPTGSSVKDIAHIARPVTKKTSSPKPPPARRESRVTNTVPGAARPPADSSTFALLPGGTPMIRRDSSAARPKRAIQAPQRDLPYNQVKPKRKENQMGLKFCDHILEEFRKPRSHKLTAAFLLPVDPVALNIPMYFKIVKRPMDLQTMTNKLKTGQYGTADEFKADFELMLENCFLFNPPGNPVYDQGKELQAAFEREWSKKDAWIKKNTPQSQRASPASDVESDGDDSDGEEEADVDGNEATIAMLREQLVNMQQTIASIAGGAKPPKAAKKSKKASGVAAKPSKKAGAPKPTIKAKPKKQRQVTYEEKQEISNATENMNDEQITKLTNIITENVPKYKDMDAEDVELEIDELPNDVQQKLLRYVRSIFPPKPQSDDGDANAIDDDYEPERPAARSGKKKHKPMKKHEQEARIKELQEQMNRLSGGLNPGKAAAVAPAATSQPDSSDDEDSESSEEE